MSGLPFYVQADPSTPAMSSTHSTKWGDMSFVSEDRNIFMRRRDVLSWVLVDKSMNRFTQTRSDFPPAIIHVLDKILLCGVLHHGAVAVEIDENFVPFPGKPISVSVLYKGQLIPFNDSTNELFISLKAMVANFPPSHYELEMNNASLSQSYKQIFAPQSGTLQPGHPIIQKSVDNNNWIRVTFRPDIHVFNIANDEVAVGTYFWKRCIDIAGTIKQLNVKVFGNDLRPQTFSEYVDGWYPQFPLEKRSNAPKRVHENATVKGQNWDVSIGWSNGDFQHVSFVNGFPTPKGGTHVEAVKRTLAFYAEEVKRTKNLDFDLQNLCVFINSTIEKPNFTSENDCLLTEFGPSFILEFSYDFIDKFANILTGLGPIALNKSVTHLTDATEAGGEHAHKCCLILTKGTSATNFTLAGYEALGRKFYGVLSIRGKLTNAKRDVEKSGIFKNQDVTRIMSSLGLEKDVCYNSAKKLRYGRLMLMMDQDHDGSHIKGLVINLLHTFWPSLLKIDFLSQFVTPVTKVKDNTAGTYHEFHSIPEYNIWAEKRQKELGFRNWTVRYYKGLASHDTEDAPEYLSNENNVKTFAYTGPQDFNAITLAFSADRVHDRRQWIMSCQEGTYLDMTQKSITYSDFFNKEFILFSVEDNRRSIPSMVDGFKPSQRKALFTALKKNDMEPKMVDTFAGEVCKETEYHHGPDSMNETIMGMSQNYVGTNNINLFVPKGIFGSRRERGPKPDARYLAILPSPMTRFIFLEADDHLLSGRVEGGKEVQPEWLLPIIPMALVNGCDGIGTGWSTNITKFDPRVIIAKLDEILTGQAPLLPPLLPWFRRFEGPINILAGSETRYNVSAVATTLGRGKVQITHLPPHIKFNSFKANLDQLVNKEIKCYDELHLGDDIKFLVEFTEEMFQKAESTGFTKFLNLDSSIGTENMHLIDEKGIITKYSSPDEILRSFADFRLPFYEKRKVMLSKQLPENIQKLQEMKRYIEEAKQDKFTIRSLKSQLIAGGYALPDDENCNYLLQLPYGYVDDVNAHDELDMEYKLAVDALHNLEGKTASELWRADLESLRQKLDLFYNGELVEDPEFSPPKRRRIGS